MNVIKKMFQELLLDMINVDLGHIEYALMDGLSIERIW